MLGAIIGDIVGSRFEFNNHRSKDFDLFTDDCFVTDDSIMTIAVAKAIIEVNNITEPTIVEYDFDTDFYQTLSEMTVKSMRKIGQRYPNCGYGGRFAKWMFSDQPKPYNSYGNGAAMRISPAGNVARTEYEAIKLSEAITSVTHNHEEGIKGAEATAVAIYMARQGNFKSEIREKIAEKYYRIDFKVDKIRSSYRFNEICQETVPQAIACFIESESFEDAIRTAISIGGDSDTIGAITGAIAEAYYGIPEDIREKALTYLDPNLMSIYEAWEGFIGNTMEQFSLLTKYIGKMSGVKIYGEWNIGDENDGTPDRPMQLPFVHYSNLALTFEKEFYQFIECHPEHELTSYGEILEARGIKWDEESMKNTDSQALDAQSVLALIMGALRAEHFCDGSLLDFFQDGSILKWLKRLKDIDFQDAIGKPSEVIFRIGGYGGYETYRLIFLDKKSVFLSEKFPEGLKNHKINSIQETENLINAWNNLHSEYWKSSYPQDFDMIVCDGTQWSLFVRYEDSCGKIYNGDNNYPESWDGLLAFFGIASDEEEYAFDDEERDKPEIGDVIYCNVFFNKGTVTYYYQTDDESINVGDRVIVPVGLESKERIAIVEEIEYFKPDKVPFPLEKTKAIIRKAPDKQDKIFNFDQFVICDEENSRIAVKVWVEVSDGCLIISGQDLGDAAEEAFGDYEYEYFYTFDRKNTEDLFALLNINSQNLNIIFIKKFSGMNGCRGLRDLCDANGILYGFFSC